MGQSVYLDHAAATPVAPEVATAMTSFLSENFYNPSALYLPAKRAAKSLDAAHAELAACIGARPSEIILTAGGTESDNLAVHGIMRAYPDAECVVSSIEHDAVLKPAANYSVKYAPVDDKGTVDVDRLIELISDKTVLVSIMYANNEVGTIQPLRLISQELAAIRAERRRTGNDLPLIFHTDACQAAAYLDIHAHDLGVDLMTLNAGKIYGPKQVGLLYIKGGTVLKPLISGGGQEFGLRSGTPNVAGAVGFAAALTRVQKKRTAEVKRLRELQTWFMKEITQRFPTATINGSLKQRLPNNIHVTFAGYDNERLIMELDERGIQAATGSACSASNDEPSHVLAAMGLPLTDIQSSIRLTMGELTTKADLQYCLDSLTAILL